MIDLVAVVGALLLAATPGEGQVEVTAPDGPLPIWTIEARRAPMSSMIGQLRETGITVTGAPADSDRLVSGEFSGELPAILSRVLRNEDFIVSQTADGYELRFLSGVDGEAGSAVALHRGHDPMPVRTALLPDPSRSGSHAGGTVADLLDVRVNQLAASGNATHRAYSGPGAPGTAETAPGSRSVSADAEQIAAMNARAAAQLSGLVAALQAACPAGRSCD